MLHAWQHYIIHQGATHINTNTTLRIMPLLKTYRQLLVARLLTPVSLQVTPILLGTPTQGAQTTAVTLPVTRMAACLS